MGVKVYEDPKGSGIYYIRINHKGIRKSKKTGMDRDDSLELAKKVDAKLILGDLGFIEEKKDTGPTLRQYLKGWNDKREGQRIGWEDKLALSRKHSTRKGYLSCIKNHILPKFGKSQIDQITSRQVNDFVFELFNAGKRSGTIKNIKNCLSAIMRDAVTDNYIQSNPVTGVRVPKPEHERALREPDPMTMEERGIFEKAFFENDQRHYPLVICGFRSGLRIGELIALQWQDVDFHNMLIDVRRNVAQDKLTTPKSKASIRHVRMSGQLAEELQRHLVAMKELTLKMGWKDVPEWVFPSDKGTYLNYGNFVNRVWNPVSRKAKVKRRTPHDMRHTYATLRLMKGDSLAEVSKEMGHSTPTITYQTYYKWIPKESKSDINELDDPASKTQAIRK